MPLSNFTRPALPYDNAPLPNDNRFNIITNVLKKPVTPPELDGELNNLIDISNILDNKIEAVQAGIITGSDNPLNAGKFPTTNGSINPTISWVNVTNDNIDDGALSGTKITPSSIGTLQLDDGIITPDKIPNNSIPYSKMDFDDNVVPGSKLFNKSVTQGQLGLLSVGTPELIDGSITAIKIAPNTLTAPALKADQLAAISTLVYTNPAVQQFHPSAAKFWCTFNGANAAISGSYNVTSVVRNGPGAYTVNYLVPFSSNNCCISISASQNAGIFIGSLSAGSCFFSIGGPPLDAAIICIVGFGPQ